MKTPRRIKSTTTTTVGKKVESMEKKKKKSQLDMFAQAFKKTTEQNMARNIRREKWNIIRRENKLQLDRWLDLPSDILELIMKRLFYADLINFRAVCKSWNSKKLITVPLVHQHPWLVIVDIDKYIDDETTVCSCKLFDPTYKKLYSRSIDMSHIHNLPPIQQVYESKYGWLLFNPSRHLTHLDASKRTKFLKPYMLFAYTPFSSVNNFIELPPLEPNIHIQFATFTTNPSMDQDCLFVVLHGHWFYHSNTIGISTCRREDKSWSTRYFKYSGPDYFWANLLRTVNSVGEFGHWIYLEGNIYYIVVPKWYDGCRNIEYTYEGLTRPEAAVDYQLTTTRVRNVKLLEPKRIVKWLDVVKRHGSDENELLYGSLMKLDDEDHDDSKYWVSKLRKEFNDYLNPFTSDCDYGSSGDYGSLKYIHGLRKILRIYPPPYY